MNVHSGVLEERRGDEAARRAAGPDLRPVLDADAVLDSSLRAAVDRARRISESQEEPFRSLAFRSLLEHLLRGGGVEQVEEPVRGRSRPDTAPPLTDMPVAEFLAQRRVDSHPDRVVAIAYYHYHRFDGQSVTTKDLVDAYTKARARRPQNYPDVIASCVRKGYLVDGGRRDGMKTWVITRTGETHVEQDL